MTNVFEFPTKEKQEKDAKEKQDNMINKKIDELLATAPVDEFGIDSPTGFSLKITKFLRSLGWVVITFDAEEVNNQNVAVVDFDNKKAWIYATNPVYLSMIFYRMYIAIQNDAVGAYEYIFHDGEECKDVSVEMDGERDTFKSIFVRKVNIDDIFEKSDEPN